MSWLNRHRTARRPAPTFEERQAWARFVDVAEACGERSLVVNAKALRGALRSTRRKRMPETQQVRSSPLMLLRDAAEAYLAAPSLEDRLLQAPELAAKARAARAAIEEPPQRRQRADIDG